MSADSNMTDGVAKKIVVDHFKEVIEQNLNFLLRECMKKVIERTERRLSFHMIPSGKNSFSLEAKWDDKEPF